MHEIKQVVDELYSSVHTEWLKLGNEPIGFPEASAKALLHCQALNRISVDSLLEHMLSKHSKKSIYSTHPASAVPLLKSPRFNIYLHLWSDEVADLHSHQWGGAFTVICGESIHARYTFRESKVYHTDLRLGTLNFLEIERLTTGDVRQVLPGLSFVHGIAHIPRPSLSLSIRNSNGLSDLSSFYRHHSNIAISSGGQDPLLDIRTRVLFSLYAKQADSFVYQVKRQLQTIDTCSAFKLLLGLQQLGISQDILAVISEEWACQSVEHSDLASALPMSLRESTFTALFVDNKSPDVRRFLAILMFSPNRSIFLKAIRTIWPSSNPLELSKNFILQLEGDLGDPSTELFRYTLGFLISASSAQILTLPVSLLKESKTFDPGEICVMLSRMRSNPFLAPLFLAD